MTITLTRLTAFAARHWLRLGLIGCALILLTQKQVNFNLRLGHPDYEPVPATAPVPPVESAVGDSPPTFLTQEQSAAGAVGGFFSRFNFFGGGEASRLEALAQLPERDIAAFITRFRHVAEAEQEKFGIPVSITLATGLLYSKAGKAAGAREHNNFFGLPCSSGWDGPTARVAGNCVRSYETAWTSFRDFSLVVTGGNFARLREFGPQDYRRWAAGLEELGFNNGAELGEQLAQTIDRYQLFRFD